MPVCKVLCTLLAGQASGVDRRLPWFEGKKGDSSLFGGSFPHLFLRVGRSLPATITDAIIWTCWFERQKLESKVYGIKTHSGRSCLAWIAWECHQFILCSRAQTLLKMDEEHFQVNLSESLSVQNPPGKCLWHSAQQLSRVGYLYKYPSRTTHGSWNACWNLALQMFFQELHAGHAMYIMCIWDSGIWN